MTTAHRAMNNIILEYKGHQFPINPAALEISNSKKLGIEHIYGGNAKAQEIDVEPSVIKGKGTFYGDDAQLQCMHICELLKENGSGWLYYPEALAIKAFFTQFDYKLDSKSNSVSYNFTFIEDCSDRRSHRLFEYTSAQKGENAFNIANREGVSVSDIMALNRYATPFDIMSGDRVRLR